MITRRGQFPAMQNAVLAGLVSLALSASALGQRSASRDPEEPLSGKPAPKLVPRLAPAVARREVDEKGMRALIEEL